MKKHFAYETAGHNYNILKVFSKNNISTFPTKNGPIILTNEALPFFVSPTTK